MNENQKLGTIMTELIRFSLPLILSGVLQQLYNWADAFIVGNVDGELSLSAIGVTSIPISFFITTITGFTKIFTDASKALIVTAASPSA